MGTYRNLPVPQPKPDDLAFWTEAKRGRFVIQQCTNCKKFRFPSVPTCKQCLSLDHAWTPVSGKGTIWSWAVFHRPYFQDVEVPYTVVIVELEEGPLVATNLVGGEGATPTIGAPVEVVFQDVDETMAIPQFKLVARVPA